MPVPGGVSLPMAANSHLAVLGRPIWPDPGNRCCLSSKSLKTSRSARPEPRPQNLQEVCRKPGIQQTVMAFPYDDLGFSLPPRSGHEVALDPANATILLIGGRIVSNYNVDITSHDENSGQDGATGYIGLMFTF